jgi:hypothetical protein
LEAASVSQRQSQEGTLAKQADEQMLAILGEIRDSLKSEAEFLVQSTQRAHSGLSIGHPEGLSYLSAQQDSVRRARNLSEREI